MTEFEANRADLERHYLAALELAPDFAERVRGATRQSRLAGTGEMRNFLRQPHGPGWALVGDAGYHKDPCTAQGMTDAFQDAELLADAVDTWLRGGRSYTAAMAAYQRARDERVLPLFELTCEFARLEPPRAELAQRLAECVGNQTEMDAFVSMIAGTLPVAKFLGERYGQPVAGTTAASALTVDPE
jgi:2-polyprenyl-6-methoxyphenol hydroxylase-like FAD-dependent oxidoreductase